MKKYLNKYLAGVALLLVVLFVATTIQKIAYLNIGQQSASVISLVTTYNASPASGFAWNDSTGWINFGTGSDQIEGRVYVSNNKLYGYAWGENIGWISMNCENDNSCGTSNYSVTQNNGDGVLTGYAWGENVGWIKFNPAGGGVNITTYTSGTNTFSGYAWGENIGWISFSGSSPNYGVTTTWTRPLYTLNYIAGANGSITGSTTQSINYGANGTTVTAEPALGYHFVNWSDATTTNPRTDTNIVANLSVTANFAINTFTLNYVAGANGSITGSTTQTINYGADGAAVTAVPNTSYSFVNWSDATTTNPRTDTNIIANLSVTANFAASGGGVGETTVTITTVEACTFTYSDWSECANDTQSRTATPSSNTCSGSADLPLTQSCIVTAIATTTATTTEDIATTTATTTIENIEISVSPASSTIQVGEAFQFTATVTGTTTNNSVTWSIIDPIENIVENFYGTISSTGLYTAPNQAVNVTIEARSSADITKTATATIEVKLIPIIPISVSIDSATSTVFAGKTIQFTSTVTGTTTNNKVNWSISPTETIIEGFYGTITSDGLYTAPNQAVNIKIIATAQADNTKTDSKDITVKLEPIIPQEVEISPTSVNVGEPITINTIDWAPNSQVTVTLYSTPIVLGTLQTDSEGKTSGSFTIPSGVEAGSHTIEFAGTGVSGSQRTLSTKITIYEAGDVIPPSEVLVVAPVTETNTGGGGDVAAEGASSSGEPETITNKVLAALDVSKLVIDNIAILGTTTQIIVLEAKKIMESPIGSAVTNTVTTVGVVGGGVAASSVFALNGTMTTDLLFLPFRLWGLLLSALGLKKRNRPWGTVYDSVTKQPLDPAYVTIKNLDTKEENTSITDLDGRYGFLVTPGRYTIAANKTNYTFPSAKLAGKTEDTLYNNLYFGEEIKVENIGALISQNIPLDPIKFDWNEFVKGKKKLMKFYSKKEKIMKIVTDWVFRIGFIISVVSLFLVSAPYNLIIFGLYMLLAALRRYGIKKKGLGSLTEKDGTPLSFAVIRVFDSELNVQVISKVADSIGRYYCLVNKGKYYVKVEKKNDDESYTEIFTSPTINAENGIINKDFIIEVTQEQPQAQA